MNRFQSRQEERQGPTAFFSNAQRAFRGLDVPLEKSVLDHLRNVYSTVAVGVGAATVGAGIHLFTNIFRANFFFSLGSIFLMYKLISTPNTRENQQMRLAMFLGFCGITGLSTGPLLEHVIAIDPSIVMTALLSSTVVFGAFTLAALYAPTTKFIHLGGTLASASLVLLISAFFAPYKLILFAGLALTVGFILYDTQMIVEKNRRGDDDYVWHSVELFIDFANMFRHILIILADKRRAEDNNRNKRRN
ncbi:unnamed protein product [Caenorhabditis auriculariae]|uniref:Bax inhibitor 1 n=1 Tax=Caenorhabditis auriculariae TaxID=2777116 RepID=A0A8S1HJZ9_9PELO|nr:unnamed protein product [Caenorhabditis auriculariae]